MMGHIIGCKGVIWKIIPELSLLPLLTWSTELFMSNLLNIWIYKEDIG